MLKLSLVAGLAVAALIPSMAAAQSCQQQRDNHVAGTVVGAGLGALAGNAIGGRRNGVAGAIIGGVSGAVIGNQLTRPAYDCSRAYGYYDNAGMWHATNTDRASASGYYDRDGDWVNGAPNGYYDGSGRWVAGASSQTPDGYYDSRGYWVPASAAGYYDSDGQWVAAAAPGHWENHPRWVAGPATGHYDAQGQWIAGAPSGHRNANGVWVADAQPGYYDVNGRWIPGPVMGYYDSQGRWTATSSSTRDLDRDVSYQTRDRWAGAPADTNAREDWLEQRIRTGMDSGSLSRHDARDALQTLQSIRADESNMMSQDGRLHRGDRARIEARLDDLNNSLRWSRANRDD
jgi:hypothetical protein